MSGQLHASAFHPLGKSVQYGLNRMLGGHQIRFGCFGEEKHLLSVPGTEPHLMGPAGPLLVHYTDRLCYPVFSLICVPPLNVWIS